MSTLSPRSTGLWLLPIVVAVAALMVVPASSVLSSRVAPASSSATPASAGSSGSASGFDAARSLTKLPSEDGLTSPLSARLAEVDASYAGAPGAAPEASAARLIAEGKLAASDVYFPSLDRVLAPTAGPVRPTYNVTPAPMGIADLGLSSSGPYSVYTADVLGSASLRDFNATGGSLYEDTSGYLFDGTSPTTEVTPWQSGLQLNTVVTNVSYPGSDAGVFWTQNVVEFSGDSLRFVDNIWNFTAPNATVNASALYSYGGVVVPNDLYYDIGPVLPLQFPITIDLYNNASVVDGRTTIDFGYRVTELGGYVATGTYDQVEFNAKDSGTLRTPDYLINGSAPAFDVGALQGPLYDAELVFGGPGAGSNAVVNQVNGSLGLSYHEPNGSWSPARAAYDYGADTGETAIGVAETWAGATAYVNQGPSVLYGLWNTTGGVPTGAAVLAIQNDPGYAFDFVGPNGSSDWNLSYVPVSSSGVSEMVLPPTAAGYNITVFADGFRQLNETVPARVTSAGSHSRAYATLVPDPTVLNAPLYLNGTALATSLARNVTGWTNGTLSFVNLNLDVNVTFNRLNDWGYPEFDLVWAYDVFDPLNFTNVTQGPDTTGRLCVDSSSVLPWTCYLSQVPYGYVDLPYYGSEIADWFGANATFTDLNLVGYENPARGIPVGGALSLWHVSNAFAEGISSTDSSFGVWASSSPDLTLVNAQAIYGGSAALTLSDSPDASARSVTATDGAAGVLDIGGAYGDFQDLYASSDGAAFEGEASNDTTVADVTAVDAVGLYFNDTLAVAVQHVDAEDGALGVFGSNATGTTIRSVHVEDAVGGELLYSVGTAITGLDVADDAIGFEIEAFSDLTIVGTNATEGSAGVLAVEGTGAWINTTSATAWSDGILLGLVQEAHVSGVDATDPYSSAPFNPASLVLGVFPVTAVLTSATNNSSVASVVATHYPAALYDEGSANLTVEDVNASNGAFGAMLNGTSHALLTDVSAYEDRVGVVVGPYTIVRCCFTTSYQPAFRDVLTGNSFVRDASYGVELLEYTYANLVFDNDFSGDNGATSTYNPAHIQAYSFSGENWFNDSVGIGNYWADWHTYADGVLAPYFISATAWDYHPLGAPEGTFVVTFAERGLASGTSWSVTVGGRTFTTVGAAIAVDELPGTYAFTVSYPDGYRANTTSGEVVVTDEPLAVILGFAPLYTASFVATGLPTGESWSVYLGGVEENGTAANLSFSVVAGSYPFSVVAPSGLAASPASGTVNVSANYVVPVRLRSTVVPSVDLVVQESGYTGPWSATIDGTTVAAVGDTASLAVPANSSFTYRVVPVAGYTVAYGSGSGTVSDLPTYTVNVVFSQVYYPVTFSESGLASGASWSVVVDGTSYPTSTTSITLALSNGSYSYTFASVSGYTVADASGTLTVAGGATGVAVTYVATPVPSYATRSTVNADLTTAEAIAAAGVALGVVALAVALLRKPKAPTPTPPAAWQEDASRPGGDGAAGGPSDAGAGGSGKS